MSRRDNISINKPKIIIYTEDSKSSNIYLSELNKLNRSKFIIQSIHKKCGGNPKKLLDEAIKDIKKKRKMIDNIKSVCIVFDLDTDVALKNYEISKKVASDNGIEIYVFEPNFEYFHINHIKKCYKNCNEELEKYYNKSLKEIKSNVRIYQELVNDKKLLINAIENCRNNEKNNRTNFHKFIELLLNI